MKLISMTAFVLQEANPSNTDTQFADKVCVYANFINKSLTLGMFVPCDDDGNVLGEPICENQNQSQQLMEFAVKSKIFDKAQSKVLFNGFLFDNLCLLGDDCTISIIKNTFRIARTHEGKLPSQEIKVCTIEDLIPYNLDLAVSF